MLVWHDLLGVFSGRQAKFVKRYANLHDEMLRGVGEYAREVRERSFPGPSTPTRSSPRSWDVFRRYLEHESLRRLRRGLVGDRDLKQPVGSWGSAVRTACSAYGLDARWRMDLPRPVHTSEIRLSTGGDADVIDITGEVAAAVAESGIDEGQAGAFVRGSTAALTTMEFEPGGVPDLRALLDRLIPVEGDYEHNRLNHDSNSHAHQRASIVGASEAVPVIGGRLALGTWQQLVLIDFDDRPRDHPVICR